MALLRYFLARLALFGICFSVVALTWSWINPEVQVITVVIVSFVLSALISVPLLRRQRAALAAAALAKR